MSNDSKDLLYILNELKKSGKTVMIKIKSGNKFTGFYSTRL